MNRSLTLLKQLAALYDLRDCGIDYCDSFKESVSDGLDVNLQEMSSLIAQCSLCALSKQRVRKLYPIGGAKKGLMIVVDEPNAYENEEGRWFSGEGGRMLKNIIERAMRLTIDDIYLTSAIKCHSFGTLSEEYVKRCAPFLINECERVKPNAILCFGTYAFGALTGSVEKTEKARGRIFSSPFGSVMATFSINHLQRNPASKKLTMEDIDLALKTAEIRRASSP
ncbi:MAG: uracil-DNA glycosylase [Helicobacteraceae bacterium]|jgi:DNA polymerase|nr:uracil-DNA glycosylase [Helicobacteraceae bacterium]